MSGIEFAHDAVHSGGALLSQWGVLALGLLGLVGLELVDEPRHVEGRTGL